MKIAFTTSGKELSSPLDGRFGRAQRFLIYDTDSKEFDLIENQQNLEAAQGAGIQAAQNVARAGAEVVVTGHCGPKAFSVLKTAGIKVFNTDAPTVAEALQRFSSGNLKPAGSADVEGHW